MKSFAVIGASLQQEFDNLLIPPNCCEVRGGLERVAPTVDVRPLVNQDSDDLKMSTLGRFDQWRRIPQWVPLVGIRSTRQHLFHGCRVATPSGSTEADRPGANRPYQKRHRTKQGYPNAQHGETDFAASPFHYSCTPGFARPAPATPHGEDPNTVVVGEYHLVPRIFQDRLISGRLLTRPKNLEPT
jgi:hypothetical protein